MYSASKVPAVYRTSMSKPARWIIGSRSHAERRPPPDMHIPAWSDWSLFDIPALLRNSLGRCRTNLKSSTSRIVPLPCGAGIEWPLSRPSVALCVASADNGDSARLMASVRLACAATGRGHGMWRVVLVVSQLALSRPCRFRSRAPAAAFIERNQGEHGTAPACDEVD